MTDSCLIRTSPGRQKTASALVYMIEELGDARMRCDQLLRYISEAVKLIEKSPQKEHFFEVAGHLIYAVPEAAFKLQKALQAVALSANRVDYEELKQELRPDKVNELENVLEDVRIRHPQRRSGPPGKQAYVDVDPDSALQVETALEDIRAMSMAALMKVNSGSWRWVILGMSFVVGRIGHALTMLGQDSSVAEKLQKQLKRVSQQVRPGTDFPEARIEQVEKALQEVKLLAAKAVTRVDAGSWRKAMRGLYEIVGRLGTVLTLVDEDPALIERLQRQLLLVGNRMTASAKHGLSSEQLQMGSVEEVREDFKKQNPDISDEDLDKVVENWFKHKDVVKDKEAAASLSRQMLESDLKTQFKALEKSNVYERLHSIADAFENLHRADPPYGQDWVKDGLKVAKLLERVRTQLLDAMIDADNLFYALERDKPRTASDKQSRHEEGESVDPTKDMSPEDAEKWKEMNDKHEDKFKKEASWKVEASRMEAGGWYKQEFKNGDEIYFHAQTQLKNKGFSGLMVKYYDGRPEKPKKDSVPTTYFHLWDEIKESDVPGPVMSKFRTRMASWKVAAAEELKDKQSRHEEGKSVDPTKDMSPEDAKKWHEMNDRHEDKFKEAAWKA